MLKVVFNPQHAQHHPGHMFFIAMVYSSIALLFSLWVFPEYASVAMIFLTAFSCLYLIQTSIKIEEEKEEDYKSEEWMLKQHVPLIKTLLALFIGFVISFAIWSFILPTTDTTTVFSVENVFAFQEHTVEGIRTAMATGAFAGSEYFAPILINNLKVLIVSLIFAAFFGAGVMYVLIWNASVMGFVIGTLAKKTFGLAALPLAFTKYFIHGIPEMLAYLLVALAGGILYVALWKGDFAKKGKRKSIVRDILSLVLIAVILLIVAAIIEVTISPLI